MFETRRFAPDGLMIIAETGFKAMNKMGYDAMNLGWQEFVVGNKFLKKAASDLGFPFVTSNLVYRDSRDFFGKEYIIKKINNIRVGIVGIMPLDALDLVQYRKGVENLAVLPPKQVLNRLVPVLKKKTDFIVLLSQCGFETTTALVNAVDGIDFAVAGGSDKAGTSAVSEPCTSEADSPGPAKVEDAPAAVVNVQYRGIRLGYFQATLDDSGKVVRTREQLINLGNNLPLDPEIAAITGDEIHQTVKDARKIQAQKQEQEFRRKVKALHKLTPEEYVQLQLKK